MSEMRFLLLVALSLMLGGFQTTAKAETYPFEGRWAAEVSWCANKPGTTDALPIRISSEAIEGYENRCAILGVAGSGNRWIVNVECSAEGETYRERKALHLRGDTLDYGNDGEVPITFVRCPRQ